MASLENPVEASKEFDNPTDPLCLSLKDSQKLTVRLADDHFSGIKMLRWPGDSQKNPICS